MPGRLSETARAHLSLRARVILLVLAALLPLGAAGVGFALSPALGERAARPLLLGFLLAAGLVMGAVGAEFAIGRPVRRLAAEVARWRDGGGFDASLPRHLPAELSGLAAAFAEAVAALRARQAELSKASAQQELVMQEIHHRVKNNLQIIASLLNLQASRIRLPEARAEFQSARDRVRALATLHRHLYSQGELHAINMRSFLEELCGQLLLAMGEREGGRIALGIEAPELQMSSDQAVPLALIVTEAVSNAIKYAFPRGRRGCISVRLTTRDEWAELAIADDGVGIPAGRAETETGVRDGLGLQLIRGFARQLGASLEVEEGGEGGAGTRYLVRMRLHPARPADEAGGGVDSHLPPEREAHPPAAGADAARG